jgi:hypothetical protein
MGETANGELSEYEAAIPIATSPKFDTHKEVMHHLLLYFTDAEIIV